MKKLLTKILLCVMTLCIAIGFAGCKSSDWQGTSMNQWGNVVSSNGGFVVETEKYVYYINGYASNENDNSFGTPVKGSLMAADKSTIGTENVKTEVVVPKLFVAQDYNAGVFIYGDYVYYGSPSTDKNNAGETAVSEMTFARTKLDGTDTSTYFTVDSLSVQYRFVQKNGVVYLIYNDTENSALVCYNTKTESSVTIAKTDSATKGRFESLKSFDFVNNEGVNGYNLFYTVTVYMEDYYQDAADNDEDYSRSEESYNKVYAYKVGDAVAENGFYGVCVLNGEAEEYTYEITSINNNYLFYTQTDVNSKVKTFGVDLTKDNAFEKATLIDNSFVLDSDAFVVSLEEVYYLYTPETDSDSTSSTEKYVVKTSLVGDIKNNWVKVASVGGASDIIAVREDDGKNYVYFVNQNNAVARAEICDENAEDYNRQERISEGAVVYAWYKPEILEINGKTYIFYCDNTDKGGNYIKYVDINAPVTGAEDTDDDDEDDVFFMEGAKFLGKIIEEDLVKFAIVDLDNIGTTVSYEENENGELVFEAVDTARKSYNALTDSGKESYGDSNLTELTNAEAAVKAIKALYKLEGINEYYSYDETTKEQYKKDYQSAKTVMENIGSDVLDLIETNLKHHYYNKGYELFESDN